MIDNKDLNWKLNYIIMLICGLFVYLVLTLIAVRDIENNMIKRTDKTIAVQEKDQSE